MARFIHLLRQDLYRTLISIKFVAVVLGIAFINYLSAWQDIKAVGGCVAYFYFVSHAMGIENIYFLLAAIPGTMLYRADLESCFYRFAVVRSNRLPYLLSKIFSSFAVTFLAVNLGDGIFLGQLSFCFPILDEDFRQQVGSHLSANIVYVMLLRAIFAAMLSQITLYVSVRIKSIFVVLFSPLAVYYIWGRIVGTLRLPVWLNLQHIVDGSAWRGSPELNLFYSVFFFLFLSLLCGCLFFSAAKEEILNE